MQMGGIFRLSLDRFGWGHPLLLEAAELVPEDHQIIVIIEPEALQGQGHLFHFLLNGWIELYYVTTRRARVWLN